MGGGRGGEGMRWRVRGGRSSGAGYSFPALTQAPNTLVSLGKSRSFAQPFPASVSGGNPARNLCDSKISLSTSAMLAWRGPHPALTGLLSGESQAVPTQQPPSSPPRAVRPEGAEKGRILLGDKQQGPRASDSSRSTSL